MGKRSLCVAVLALAGCATTSPQPDAAGATLPAAELVGMVNAAWADAQDDIHRAGMDLTAVNLEIKATDSRTGSGGVQALVLAAGASRGVTSSHGLTIKLVRPKPNGFKTFGDTSSEVQKLLRDAMADVGAFAGSIGKPSAGALALGDVTADIGFDLVASGSGGVTLALGPVQVGGGLAREVSGTHLVELTFSPCNSPKADCGP